MLTKNRGLIIEASLLEKKLFTLLIPFHVSAPFLLDENIKSFENIFDRLT